MPISVRCDIFTLGVAIEISGNSWRVMQKLLHRRVVMSTRLDELSHEAEVRIAAKVAEVRQRLPHLPVG
jgi:hypothetical protein